MEGETAEETAKMDLQVKPTEPKPPKSSLRPPNSLSLTKEHKPRSSRKSSINLLVLFRSFPFRLRQINEEPRIAGAASANRHGVGVQALN
ncbi:hypothetical protein Nepgr_033031 [Nepenthes gracilis]|uniref:Uncharacterized protein n=1 Tax=Nepenthes gracilis TaxID=150966 RepID=A0AAD3TJT1_NEPGR|nr:hypothetical protein Nepgr_033031 [Nepenthes gracilis]